ncbi:MAG: L,D-transpeptidase [Rhizobiaceae bacterium]
MSLVVRLFLGLFFLVSITTSGQARTSADLSFNLDGSNKLEAAKPAAPEGVQVAHHTPEQWAAHLRRKRAKRLRQKRLRARKIRKIRKAKRTRTAKLRSRQTTKKVPELYARKEVKFTNRERPGTVIVETRTRHLYYVLDGKRAIRYGVAVGKEGFAWSGSSTVKRKVEWPKWYPPKEMIKRKPKLKKWANGQPGGPKNPLGAAALYLFQGKKDTLYRIHGTNAPSSIGTAASSGCIRMRNEDIQHLYSKVGLGTKVIVR